MVVSWALLLLWLVLNALDIVIAGLATRLGVTGGGLLYQFWGTSLAMSINRMILALLIGILLTYSRRGGLLSLLSLGMLGLCIYNGYVLLNQLW